MLDSSLQSHAQTCWIAHYNHTPRHAGYLITIPRPEMLDRSLQSHAQTCWIASYNPTPPARPPACLPACLPCLPGGHSHSSCRSSDVGPPPNRFLRKFCFGASGDSHGMNSSPSISFRLSLQRGWGACREGHVGRVSITGAWGV